MNVKSVKRRKLWIAICLLICMVINMSNLGVMPITTSAKVKTPSLNPSYSTYRWFNFFIMLLGVILFAVGTGLYASASLGRGSYEAVTFALAEKNHWQIKFVRMALDILVVVTGVLFGGKFGVCTLITVIISGPIIQFVNAKAKQVLKI